MQWARHPFRVDVPLAREPERRLDQVHEALARRDLDAHDGVRLGFVPPIVSRGGLENPVTRERAVALELPGSAGPCVPGTTVRRSNPAVADPCRVAASPWLPRWSPSAPSDSASPRRRAAPSPVRTGALRSALPSKIAASGRRSRP